MPDDNHLIAGRYRWFTITEDGDLVEVAEPPPSDGLVGTVTVDDEANSVTVNVSHKSNA